ncbi:MAG: hypothetical protein ACT4PM_06970 [Gemmatimonadales bacterium]
MALEVLAAALLGFLVLWLAFGHILTRSVGTAEADLPEPEPLEETRRGAALLALREIEFDRETGKLSDEDYRSLKARYGALALEAIEAEERAAPLAVATSDAEELIGARAQALRAAGSSAPIVPLLRFCPRCGPRPEPEARYCSRCGLGLGNGASRPATSAL